MSVNQFISFALLTFFSKLNSMAYPTIALINALRTAARNIQQGAPYAWGNHGQCNCGHLLQSLTGFSAKHLVSLASGDAGEWTELAEEYCDNTNLPLGQLMAELQTAGLTPSDIHHLEYLTDKEVLHNLPGGFRWLKRNNRHDVVLYFSTLATMLENKLQANASRTLQPVKASLRFQPNKRLQVPAEEEQLYCALQ